MLKIGEINRLNVLRKTDIGYMLDASDGEVFLHNNESNHQNLKTDDTVDAFLYFDQ
ncbi:MAG: S1 RNA-binding domain-containing protein, partial [Acholeplasmataceae bacterium]|nr:S1 RNA-binding domain-containing protein [Acholeplasmataceae bacterium]